MTPDIYFGLGVASLLFLATTSRLYSPVPRDGYEWILFWVKTVLTIGLWPVVLLGGAVICLTQWRLQRTRRIWSGRSSSSWRSSKS